MPLNIGDKAPDFELKNAEGRSVSLSKDYMSSPLIIYFFPKAFTPGCNKESCLFRDSYSEFKNLEIPVIGISRDKTEKLQKFKENFDLPFELLSDDTSSICKSYKALIPLIGFPKRVTYLLDENHTIIDKCCDLLNPGDHVNKLLESAKNQFVKY